MSAVDDRVQQYIAELYRWNARINLTSVAREDATRRHVDESRRLLDAAAAGDGASLVDVGSGGGVPGLVIAILRPRLRVVLIEADRRKAGFLIHAAALFGHGNVEVIAGRAEEAGRDPGHRERHDLAVSRAAAAAPVLCELALPLLREGGRVVALVGDAAADAAAAAFAASVCGGGVPVALDRDILAVTKIRASPDAYPRRTGLPSRRPLG